MTSELKVLQQQFPRVQACWAAIVLYGQHSATYKFALARCLLELAQRGQKRVSLEELAVPYAWYLCIHTARAPRQFTSRSSTVFRSCEEFNAGKINQEALLQVVVQYGFNNVLDAFHIVNGEAVGSITVMLNDDVYCKSAELGYWLGEPFWGRGIMTAAVETMCREGFAAWDIVRIHAEAFARNAASRRVLEKAGFALEGTLRRSVYKNGEMLDSCIYALVREEAP